MTRALRSRRLVGADRTDPQKVDNPTRGLYVVMAAELQQRLTAGVTAHVSNTA